MRFLSKVIDAIVCCVPDLPMGNKNYDSISCQNDLFDCLKGVGRADSGTGDEGRRIGH